MRRCECERGLPRMKAGKGCVTRSALFTDRLAMAKLIVIFLKNWNSIVKILKC
jgi:hypothetical protein